MNSILTTSTHQASRAIFPAKVARIRVERHSSSRLKAEASCLQHCEFEKQIDSVYEMIRPYVEKDPTAFYTPDEFDTGYETLKKFCLLRAESIRRQLDGKLSTKTDEQDEKDKVTVEGITVSDMGRPSRGKDEVAADEAATGAN